MNQGRNFPHFILITMMLVFATATGCRESGDLFTKDGDKGIKVSKNVDLNALNQLLASTFDSSRAGSFFPWENDTLNRIALFKQVYSAKTSLWFNEKGINQQGSDLLKVLNDLQFDGLDISKYRVAELKQLTEELKKNANEQNIFTLETRFTDAFLSSSRDMLLGARINTNKEIKNGNDSLINEAEILLLAIKNGDLFAAFETMRPKHPWYKRFRQEYVRLSSIKTDGGFQLITVSKDSFQTGDSSVQIAGLRKRLNREIKSPSDTVSQRWDTDLQESLRKFQYLHQLKISGKLDTATLKRLNTGIESKLTALALNMERMRWLKHDFNQPYIWVAIPKMEMDYIDHDTIEFNMRVVVGRPSRATPALDASILNVVLSPPWNVPPTIMREEVVPGIARRGGAYLARRGLRAYDRRGRQVSASAINSKNYRNFSIGQAPGYSSSLGEVKFNMPNPWAIYMHDTPHREDFVKYYRAFSSGCVRVQKPKEFATFLLRDSLNYSYAKIDSICKLRKTIFVPVNRKIDVHFVYLTNALDSTGNVMYLKDIYGWD